MAFRIGQKVVCVDDTPESYIGAGTWDYRIRRGGVYEIRWTGRYQRFVDGPIGPAYLGVRLSGIDRSAPGVKDTPFRASRFRPVVERKTETGMAILRKILERESHQDRAPAKATNGRVTDAAAQHGTEEA